MTYTTATPRLVREAVEDGECEILEEFSQGGSTDVQDAGSSPQSQDSEEIY